MKVIAYKIPSDVSTARELLNGLMVLKGFDNIAVCWDLDATVAQIMRHTNPEVCKELQDTRRVKYGNYGLFYMPGKVFSIRYGGQLNLYDLSQYYPDDDEPQTIIELQQKAGALMSALKEMKMYPSKLTSPIAIFKQCILDHTDLPAYDTPAECQEYALRTAGRLWIESMVCGYVPQAYSYDLSSAFPSVMRELVDTSHLTWGKTKEYVDNATYGFCKGLVTIYDGVKISPIFYDDEEGRLTSRAGTWQTYLTKADIDFINYWKIGEFKIQSGWWGIPKPHYQLKIPFQPVLDRLLVFKKHDNSLVSRLAKRMSVGSYGAFGEEWDDRYADHFNPVWFAMTSTRIRLLVAHFIYVKNIIDNILHIGVDGILMDKPIDKLSPQWKYKGEHEAILVSSGLVYIDDKKPKGLYIDDIKELIKKHPRSTYYHKNIPRYVTLGQAVAFDMYDKLGQVVPMRSAIDLVLMERDRDYPKLPETGQQLMKGIYKSSMLKVKGG